MTKRLITALCCLLLALPAWAAELLYLNTPAGSERLVSATLKQHFFFVQPYVESQQNLAFCGPASIAATLNSMEIRRPAAGHLHPYGFFTQDNIFTPATERIKSSARVSMSGMTLAETTAFFNALNVKASRYHADELDLDALRTLIRAALQNPKQRIIVNYSRQALGQAGSGHMSPLGAYDEKSDSVLLLDVAKFKYPPAWITLPDLLSALRTTDPDSGKSRGVVVVGP